MDGTKREEQGMLALCPCPSSPPPNSAVQLQRRNNSFPSRVPHQRASRLLSHLRRILPKLFHVDVFDLVAVQQEIYLLRLLPQQHCFGGKGNRRNSSHAQLSGELKCSQSPSSFEACSFVTQIGHGRGTRLFARSLSCARKMTQMALPF